MIKRLLSILYFWGIVTSALAQETTYVTGSVVDATTGESIAGATIIVKGKVIGTSSDASGEFSFGVTLEPPFTLVFSMIDYDLREVNINKADVNISVNLRPKSYIPEEFVVYGSRFGESILSSPITIEKMDDRNIREVTASDFYEGITDFKGVIATRSSGTFTALNTRGFNATANSRFVQLIDEIDNALPGFNVAAGNLLGVSELDMAELELIPGASSALYGPNAFTGILFLNTKNPYDYQGLSVMVRNGFTQQEAAGTTPYGEVGLRWAIANDLLAFKVNLSAMKGTDWYAADYQDINQLNSTDNASNPNYNGINIYGDEINRTINFDAIAQDPAGTYGTHTIARTGYKEVDLVDYVAESYKGDVALHGRVTDNIELIASHKAALGTTVYQGANRFYFDKFSMNQSRLELKGGNFFVRGYHTWQNTGNTYDTRIAAFNMNEFWKSDKNWFNQYTLAYIGGVTGVDASNHEAARAYADRDRLAPETDAFRTALDSITSTIGFEDGAKIIDKTKLYHVEGNLDFSEFLQFMDIQIGGSYRSYILNSEGTIFTDVNDPICINEYGVYTQGKKDLMDDRLSISWALRYDKNQNFEGIFSPRLAAVYALGKSKEHNVRVSFQTGFRNPTVQNQYIGLNQGTYITLGGTQANLDNYSIPFQYIENDSLINKMITGNDVYTNSYTASSVETFLVSNDENDLQAANLDLLQPEQVTTFEVGYKGLINKRLYVEATYFNSTYDQLIGLTNVIHPMVGTVGESSGIFDIQVGRIRDFQLFVNAKEKIKTQGISASAEYLLPSGFMLSAHYNYTKIAENTLADDFVAFNMPQNMYGFLLENRNVYRGFGFRITHRFIDKFQWYSTFGQGLIPQANITSAQVTYQIPGTRTILKMGSSNLLNQEYQTAIGSPSIGAKYYFSIVFDESL